MRVELTVGLFTTDTNVEEILMLLRHFGRGRHQWAISPLQFETVKKFLDRHVPQLAQGYCQLALKESVLYEAYMAPSTAPLVRVSPDDLVDHAADLDRPATIVVENDSTDKGFVLAILRAYDGQDLIKAIERNWLVVEHGGGSDTYRRAEEKHGEFRRLTRTAVVFDSDRMMPGTPEKNASRIERVRQCGVLVHVLTLREAENYLPNRLFQALKPYRESPSKIALLKRLTPAQRGYFDMKKGFPKGIPDSQATLYAGVPDRVVRGLRSGFGDNVIKLFEVHLSQPLTDRDFDGLGPGVSQELRSIVALLRKIV
jgi:hypothetical protein